MLSLGNGKFKKVGQYLDNWCGKNHVTQHVDINGDGKADLVCDAEQR